MPKRRGGFSSVMFSAIEKRVIRLRSWCTAPMPARDRLARIAEPDRPAIEPHLPRIRLVHAGQDLDQRGLAGAVLAQQRVDLATPDGEVHMIECLHADEALGGIVHLDEGVAHDRRTAGAVPSRASRSRFSPTAPRISRPSSTWT